MTDASIQITGLKETARTLYAYSQQLGDRVIRGALRQGANHVLRGLRPKLPVRTGLLRRRGFRVVNSRLHNGKRSSDLIGVYIGLRKGKGAPFYGRFINDGWQAGQTRVPGRHFVQNSFAERRESAVQLIVRSAEAGAAAIKHRLGMK